MENTPGSEDTTEGAGSGPHPSETYSPTDESRRQFGKTGLAVGSAVILTVLSRPVLAGGGHGYACKSPSGFESGNVSQHGPGKTCEGRTPGYWKECYHTHYSWPPGYHWGHHRKTRRRFGGCNNWHHWGGGTLAKDVFNCTGWCERYGAYRSGGGIHYCSLQQVMLMGGNEDPQQLGGHLVAALFNAEMGWTGGVLSVQAVKDMWNEYAVTGGYVPTAGAPAWSAAEIVDYLKSTMS